jgi:MSHA pilin protein MshC
MAGSHADAPRTSSRRLARRHHGFTVVELILVIVLVGIISAVAMTRFFDRTVFDADAATEQLRATLRYAQKIAIAQHRPVFVQLAPNRIALCFRNEAVCAPADQVVAPSGDNSGSAATLDACGSRTWMCEGRPASITATANIAVLGFDALGQPFNVPQTAAFGGLTVTIRGGAATRTVTVAAETGHVS